MNKVLRNRASGFSIVYDPSQKDTYARTGFDYCREQVDLARDEEIISPAGHSELVSRLDYERRLFIEGQRESNFSESFSL